MRVSQVGGRSGAGFQSPAQQREAIAAWASAHGETIAQWHEDLDQSGGTMARPGMDAALERVQSGATGGIVVARLDRFARNLVGGLTTIEAIHGSGGRVVSVAESIDPATPAGRMMLGVLLVMAEWQREQAAEGFRVAQQHATARGRYPAPPAYGYVNDPATGLRVIDPERAEAVRLAFEMRAAGAGWRTIAGELARRGYPTARGRAWAPATVAQMVRRVAYIGRFERGGIVIDGAWEPIVSGDEWRAANALRGQRPGRLVHDDMLVRGVARCASCGMVLKRRGGRAPSLYACFHPTCPQSVTITAAALDPVVADMIDERLARLGADVAADDTEYGRLAALVERADAELAAWRDDVELREALGTDDWRAGMLARARARDAAHDRLDAHRQTVRALPAGLERLPPLEGLPWATRRAVARAFLHAVWVRPAAYRGRATRRRVEGRIVVEWRDDPDVHPLPSLSEPWPRLA